MAVGICYATGMGLAVDASRRLKELGMENGILVIEKPTNQREVSQEDLLLVMMFDLGARCSAYQYTQDQTIYTDKWEWFDPAKVENPDALPDYWRAVYDLHTNPRYGDCVELGYRYMHAPERYYGEYPDIPVAGIFVVGENSTPDNVGFAGVVHVGDELLNFMTEKV